MTNEHNPHHYATVDNNDTSIAQITDAVDFPHTGLIKALSLGIKGNYVVKGSATDFDITQSTGTNKVVVAAGKIFRDGALHTVATKNFEAASFQETANTHHLLVADSATPPVLQIRKHGSSTQNAIPPYTEGDTIIAVITYTTGFNAMNVQFLTTGKVANNVSIGYDSSGYNEAMSISASAGDTTIENKVSDKDIIFKVNDGGTAREILRLDADDNEVRIVSTIDGAGQGPQLTLFRDTADATDNDLVGVVSFKGENDANAETEYVRIQAEILDETDTTEDSQLYIRTMKAGSLAFNLKFTPTQTIFNAANEDIDVRIDGAADNLFYADSATNTVGIGTGSNDTNAKLTVEGAISLDEISAPTNTADRGQLYTNADNHLHFINGAGTDVKVTEEVFIVALSDETTNLATGTAKASFHMPFAMTLTAVKANCTTAPVGSTIIVDINEAGSTILSTKLSIDASELTSSTAASAAVISDTALANDALITFDIDQVGSTTAGKGLKVTLYGYRA